jgi:hypothetical protein
MADETKNVELPNAPTPLATAPAAGLICMPRLPESLFPITSQEDLLTKLSHLSLPRPPAAPGPAGGPQVPVGHKAPPGQSEED